MSLIKKHSRSPTRSGHSAPAPSSSSGDDSEESDAADAAGTGTETASAATMARGLARGNATGTGPDGRGDDEDPPSPDDFEEATDTGAVYVQVEEDECTEPPPETCRRPTRFATCSFPTARSDTAHSELTIAQIIAYIEPNLADADALADKALDFLQTKGVPFDPLHANPHHVTSSAKKTKFTGRRKYTNRSTHTSAGKRTSERNVPLR